MVHRNTTPVRNFGEVAGNVQLGNVRKVSIDNGPAPTSALRSLTQSHAMAKPRWPRDGYEETRAI